MKLNLTARFLKFMKTLPSGKQAAGRIQQALLAVFLAFNIISFLLAAKLVDPTAQDPWSGIWGRFFADVAPELPRPEMAFPSLIVGTAVLLFLCSLAVAPYFSPNSETEENDDSYRPTAGTVESSDARSAPGPGAPIATNGGADHD